MAIKSLEDLKRIREESQKKVNLRETGESTEDVVELLVGMATCGIAAGARETLSALLDEAEKQDLNNVRIVQVGCLGYCHSEPTVQVNLPGHEPIIFGKVDDKRAREIITRYVMRQEMLEDSVVINTFVKA
jgi:NADP-reducing hydrogenase subunit HndB